LNKKKKKYKPEELQNKIDVLNGMKENFDLLKRLYLD
jgi:hypothetical protein